MFATLLGGLPWPDGSSELNEAIEAVVRAQEDVGLEPVTDGRLRDPEFNAWIGSAETWRLAAGLTNRAVKQALPGPYSLGLRATEAGAGNTQATRGADTLAFARALRIEVEALAAAGCPMVEIEETEGHRIGEDEAERQLFREAHDVLARGMTGTHLSLSLVGKAAWSAGVETVLAAPYASLAVDLINGPDNWNLVTRAPADRGIVVGALGARESADEAKELLLWGAQYAAATQGRGIARVGIGSAGSYANLTWAAALRKLAALGEAARIAALPPGEELTRSVDPRSISARRAALGGLAGPGPKRRRR